MTLFLINPQVSGQSQLYFNGYVFQLSLYSITLNSLNTTNQNHKPIIPVLYHVITVVDTNKLSKHR
jgi:hypothetical protein